MASKHLTVMGLRALLDIYHQDDETWIGSAKPPRRELEEQVERILDHTPESLTRLKYRDTFFKAKYQTKYRILLTNKPPAKKRQSPRSASYLPASSAQFVVDGGGPSADELSAEFSSGDSRRYQTPSLAVPDVVDEEEEEWTPTDDTPQSEPSFEPITPYGEPQTNHHFMADTETQMVTRSHAAVEEPLPSLMMEPEEGAMCLPMDIVSALCPSSDLDGQSILGAYGLGGIESSYGGLGTSYGFKPFGMSQVRANGSVAYTEPMAKSPMFVANPYPTCGDGYGSYEFHSEHDIGFDAPLPFF